MRAGRLLLDLGRPVAVAAVNTLSGHKDARGPQVYAPYASDGTAAGFEARPGDEGDPAKVGWTLLARLDTRPGKAAGTTDGKGAATDAPAQPNAGKADATEADNGGG